MPTSLTAVIVNSHGPHFAMPPSGSCPYLHLLALVCSVSQSVCVIQTTATAVPGLSYLC